MIKSLVLEVDKRGTDNASLGYNYEVVRLLLLLLLFLKAKVSGLSSKG